MIKQRQLESLELLLSSKKKVVLQFSSNYPVGSYIFGDTELNRSLNDC